MVTPTQAFVDGRPADSAALIRFARNGYHHFTSLQVRNGAVRGLELHLARLETATQQLFEAQLDRHELCRQMLVALAGHTDAGLRISIGACNYCARSMSGPARLETLILVDPPAPAQRDPVRLMSFRHDHAFPTLKHAGNFDLLHLRRQALTQGFDDAVLLGPSGEISEGATFSLGFFAGDALIWPQAEALPSTTRQLVHEACIAADGQSRERRLAIADLGNLDAAFCANAGGLWPILAIDDRAWPVDTARMRYLRELWDSISAVAISTCV